MILKHRRKILVSFLLISGLAFGVSFIISSDKVSINFLTKEQKTSIVRYILPYIEISNQKEFIALQKNIISDLKNNLVDMELMIKEEGDEIQTIYKEINLSNGYTLKKYKMKSGFYAGIHEPFPGSGFIDFFDDNLVILSSRGVLAFKTNLDDHKKNFKIIKNNIEDFIGVDQFYKGEWFSLKDILVSDKKIYISYTEEIKENCWNTSIIHGDMNLENIVFSRLFSAPECISSVSNIDNIFNAVQSGGRIISLGENHILLSTGEYRQRYLAQEPNSINGKTLKIDIRNGDYSILSMGHRNSQGLYFDQENNFIVATEHGPRGGDEVNLINLVGTIKEKTQNFGWPIASAGEHYKATSNKKYPLSKSHSKYGLVEPLKSFVPSIGISEIVKIGPNKYVVSSTIAQSLIFLDISDENYMLEKNIVKVHERVRDLKIRGNQLFLFLENSASIGTIDLTVY